MSALSRWLLIPPVSARLSERYQGYRRHGASPFSAALGCLWTILAWIVFPLEHPRWQRIRDGHKALYPHINAARPRPLDPARYLIQTLWLVMISSAKERHEPRWRSFARLKDVRGRYHQWMDTLPERVRQKTTHLEKEKELGHLSNGARRFILGVIVTFSLILALICITQPFNPLSQFIFLLLLWGVALLVRRMPGRFSALMLIVLSLTVSCRYIWWRYTSTLNWDDPVSLVCGLILLFAETYAWIVLGLGDVAMARKDNAAAERYYQQTLRMDSGNTNAVRGLANLYRQQSPQKAAAFIASLSASQRRSIDDIERSLENDRLAQQAETLESEGKWAQAAELHRRRLALDPGSVWVTYRLSRDLWQAGQHAQADAQMRSLAQQKPNDPEQVYAYGLYLSGSDRDRAALAHLNTLPTSQWNSNIQELAGRLQSNQVLESANRLRDSGKEREAEALLRQQPPSTRIALTLADWAQQRGDNAAARAAYDAVLAREPGNVDAMLGRVEIDIAQGDNAAARAQLAALPASQITSINMQRRVALAQLQLGDITAAARTFNRITPQAKAQPPSMESAMVLRDAAAFQAQTGEPQRALETYKEAMVAAAITPVRPQDNDTFTRLTRNDEKDDWLKRGVRSDAAELYRQQDLNVTLAHDYWGSSGTGGYSDLKAHTTMLQVDAPWSDGRAFFRTDMVNMDVGRFSTDADGKYDNNWGTCTLEKCSGHRSQADTGASVAVGWQNETWRWDIGTTPMGFNVVDVVGGVSYSDDIGPLGYTLNAHRRPISSSLLAFGGQKDASSNTGTKWGGVRANGGGISLSYDKGEANGVWASLSGDQLSGKNVEDNWRVRWMTGYYYKVINENNRRVTVGLNNMIWHYDKDLSGYSLGQGGYYSPQEYLSFAVPVMWRQRTENWSWELGGSVSWSHSRNRTMPRYPLMNLIPADYQEDARDQTNGGGSSQGFGYTVRALIERRVTANWFVGTAVDIQQAKDYTPSHLLLYVRYSAAGWQGDMDLPPQPLVPYADW
ncbi:cellulose biosynthesis protein BcsC [Salmonella enterica subsp. enterica]|uniref:Cellulose biosynthesis protein BcsC n=6 Tax=Salmonella enterica TaxID=28901 RepID=A0A738J166_SALET|nr:cellulose biosynthesis protein BcsC [Salmonella enterica subsp. enterica]ECI2438386.1 cellulose biosynthesis protein BcsC [Salmonella enterica subsp. enterica]HAE8894233.1 cellulose biosynthesis protein BcsC [Salmonella enterica subsp. enterica serovar Cerro]